MYTCISRQHGGSPQRKLLAARWWLVLRQLVGEPVYPPLWKMMDFVNWDDEIPFILMGKCQKMATSHHQPVGLFLDTLRSSSLQLQLRCWRYPLSFYLDFQRCWCYPPLYWVSPITSNYVLLDSTLLICSNKFQLRWFFSKPRFQHRKTIMSLKRILSILHLKLFVELMRLKKTLALW